MGRLRRARYVQHRRNAGWPNGREPQGHGVSVVVRGRESRPHGEGRQVGCHLKGEGSEMDDDLIRVDVASLESCLTSKESRAVRRGAVGKGPRELHLAGRLPYCKSGSEGGGWKSTHQGNSLTAYPTTRCSGMKADPAHRGP